MQHEFTGPAFTIGIEEELMLIDEEGLDLAQGMHEVMAAVPESHEGQVKYELFQSVLEIATTPCKGIDDAATELADLRRLVAGIAEERGMLVGAAGTHPFAKWENQRIVEKQRYMELVEDLRFIARQELIFGTHVHVGIDGPEKAIYVADGIRRYLPLLLALSTNSPFWRGEQTGMMSARTPVFRAFPRVGIPPHYGSWEIYNHRVDGMVRSGAIEDYTYLWWDVRPHPKLGTVETRIFDQQTRLDLTLAMAALTQCLAHRLSHLFDESEPLVEQPSELVDDNKIRAALRGMEGDLIDLRHREPISAIDLARRLLSELGDHADELGCRSWLEPIDQIFSEGSGARRQLRLYERDGDLRKVVRAIVERTRPENI